MLGAFAAGYFWFQIPGGWLGNRIGTRAAFPLIHSLWSVCTLWSSLAGSWLMLAASRVGYGLAQAGMVPLAAKVINDWFHVSRRGICSATFAASMSVGGVISMGLTAMLMDHFHWRIVFRMYSLVGIAWAIAFYALFRTKPEEHPWVRSKDSSDEPAAPAEVVGDEANSDAEQNAPPSTDNRRTLESHCHQPHDLGHQHPVLLPGGRIRAVRHVVPRISRVSLRAGSGCGGRNDNVSADWRRARGAGGRRGGRSRPGCDRQQVDQSHRSGRCRPGRRQLDDLSFLAVGIGDCGLWF